MNTLSARQACVEFGVNLRLIRQALKNCAFVSKIRKEKFYTRQTIKTAISDHARGYEYRRYDCYRYSECLDLAARENLKNMPCKNCVKFERDRLGEFEFLRDLAGCYMLLVAICGERGKKVDGERGGGER